MVQQDSRFAFFPDQRVRDSFRQIQAALGGPGSLDRTALRKRWSRSG